MLLDDQISSLVKLTRIKYVAHMRQKKYEINVTTIKTTITLISSVNINGLMELW